jgi:hypothetical protein
MFDMLWNNGAENLLFKFDTRAHLELTTKELLF